MQGGGEGKTHLVLSGLLGFLSSLLSGHVGLLSGPQSGGVSVAAETAVLAHVTDGSAVGDDLAGLLLLLELLGSEAGEPVLGGDEDPLLPGEFHLGATEGLEHVGAVAHLGADAEDDLADVHTGHHPSGLTERTTHTGLQTIRTGARKHLVDTENVEGVDAHTEMETVLPGELAQVLVGADTGSLKSLRAVVLLLERHEVHAEREILDGSALVAKIVDLDLGVGNTTAVAGLDVGLPADVTIATARTSTHG